MGEIRGRRDPPVPYLPRGHEVLQFGGQTEQPFAAEPFFRFFGSGFVDLLGILRKIASRLLVHSSFASARILQPHLTSLRSQQYFRPVYATVGTTNIAGECICKMGSWSGG
jgi:hypothetical protein